MKYIIIVTCFSLVSYDLYTDQIEQIDQIQTRAVDSPVLAICSYCDPSPAVNIPIVIVRGFLDKEKKKKY